MRGIEDAIAVYVPALQAGDPIMGTRSWGFTPGYHIAGLRPCVDGSLAYSPTCSYCFRTN